MLYQSRPRKRVLAIRRGPDGSAFQKCESCGLTVAIALADMHECGVKKITKKKHDRLAFCREEFIKTCKGGNEIEIDKKGCETWQNMSKEERRPFVLQADKLNSAYVKLLLKEESEMQWVDDEADSGDVGKYDETYEDSDIYRYDSESSDGFQLFQSETCDTLDTQILYVSLPFSHFVYVSIACPCHCLSHFSLMGTIMPLGYSETSLKIEHDHEASVYFPARRTWSDNSALARINWRQVILAIVSNVRLSCDVASASEEFGRIDILSDVHVEKRVL
ncbi:UNVERIFIED_CONTAM: hypothetical protein Slati_1244700 [Sesamum latifolium]|uniref:Uncharacterized protein n=1 Tax=Sesamum latifolium TaxID=2727402 RepID=A0AAW2XKC4_9LAMI